MRSFIILCIAMSVHLYAYNPPFEYDPFEVANRLIKTIMPNSKEVAVSKKRAIAVGAIMSGRAFINGHWYALGDKFGSYKVDMIGANIVGLRKNGKTKIFTVGKKKKLLTIKEKE